MNGNLHCNWIIGALGRSLVSAMAAVTVEKDLPGAAQFAIDGGRLRIPFCWENIVRVTYPGTPALPEIKPLSVVGTPGSLLLKQGEDDKVFTLESPGLKVRIDRLTGAVGFLNHEGQVLLGERPGGI